MKQKVIRSTSPLVGLIVTAQVHDMYCPFWAKASHRFVSSAYLSSQKVCISYEFVLYLVKHFTFLSF